MILAHHHPWLNLAGSIGDILLTVWFLIHVFHTHRADW